MREFIFTTEQELEIINKKNSGEKVSNIAQEYGIQKHLVYQILKRNGREKVIANKKYEVDENYFENIDTEEKAYRIHWYSRNDINNVYNYLYKDSTIFLERKKEKFIEIFNSYVK